MVKTRHQQKKSKKQKAMYKVMKGGSEKTILLIIDPQVDFITGSLTVPNAVNDITKIIALINAHGDKIDEIHVTLDSHSRAHIAHAGFWEPKGKAVPLSAFQLLTLEGDRIIQLGQNENEYVPKDKGLSEYAKAYVGGLTEKNTEDPNKPLLCIWPDHCIVTEDTSIAPPSESPPSESTPTPGWKIPDDLWNTLNGWRETHQDGLYFHEKGTNNYSEMYSVFEAELPYETIIKANSDIMNEGLKYKAEETHPDIKAYKESEFIRPSDRKFNLRTDFNKKLFRAIVNDKSAGASESSPDTAVCINKVLVCGEAKSHCVRTSVTDFVKHLTGGHENITLLEDAMSNVEGDSDFLRGLFKGMGDGFVEDMVAKGLKKSTTITVFNESPTVSTPTPVEMTSVEMPGGKKKSLKKKRRSHKKK